MADEHADDPRIRNCAELWRRIPPVHFIRDENLGRVRPTSAAFNDSKDSPMSAVAAKIVVATRRDEYLFLEKFPNEGLVGFSASLARKLRQGVELAPVDGEPGDVHIFGPKPKKAVKAEFAKRSIWIVGPDAENHVVLPTARHFRRIRCLLGRLLRAPRHSFSARGAPIPQTGGPLRQ